MVTWYGEASVEEVIVEKLVRDKIPELICAAGKQPVFRVARKSERLQLLIAKLREETDEFEATPSLDELVDLLAVLHALQIELSIADDVLAGAMSGKAADRGAFQCGIVLTIPGARRDDP